jgi:BlaI family transcriptional regulator, penicillinase repressor
MSKKVKLTLVEWELMESIWTLGGKLSSRNVHEYLFPNGEKAYTTVQTLLNKLHDKGFLNRKKIGMVNFFWPKVTRRAMIKEQLSFFISNMFNDSVPALTNFLIDSNDLSLKEIQSIKKFIETKEQELENSDD